MIPEIFIILNQILQPVLAYKSVARNKKVYDVIMLSSKHNEITCSHKFTYVFISNFVWVAWKKCQKWEIWEKDGLAIYRGLKPLAHYGAFFEIC